MSLNANRYCQDAINLLKQMIAIPSFSKQEAKVANLLFNFFEQKSIPVNRQKNNIWIKNKHWQKDRPTLLLNSHHDTVRAVDGWTLNPFEAKVADNKLYGLGSNDAGGSLVALVGAFLHFYENENLAFNLILALTAEEEISGPNGISSILDQLGDLFVAIVGEPTQMQMAIAERGLLVIDAQAKGKAGHAARKEGINALYRAMEDIEQIRAFQFPKVSSNLGTNTMTVTQIEAGRQHNVIPDVCHFVIDVRVNDCYTNKEVFNILQDQLKSKLTARSFRLNSSQIDLTHPLVEAAKAMGIKQFASSTLSDQALLPFPSVKIGCGKSSRSHTANEFIYLHEIEEGLQTYIQLIDHFQTTLQKQNDETLAKRN